MTTKTWNVPLVEVALPVPDTEPLTYRLLKPQYGAAEVGRIAQVPLKSRKVSGVVVDVRRGKPVPGLRSVDFIRTDIPPLPDSLMKFTRWVADYYLCSWGEALKAALPAGVLAPSRKVVWLAVGPQDGDGRIWKDVDPRWLRILAKLQEGGPRTMGGLQAALEMGSIRHTVSAMEKAGLVEIRDVVELAAKPKYVKWYRLTDAARGVASGWGDELVRAPKQLRILEALYRAPEGLTWEDLVALTGAGRGSVKALVKRGWVELTLKEDRLEFPEDDMVEELPGHDRFTEEQRRAAQVISEALSAGTKAKPILLFGCTGSGKTLLYIEAIEKALEKGRAALVLVPEISLTPQTVRRFRSAFGNKVAVQHSAQPPRERALVWRKILQGEYPVVVGARSAVFAPLPNLGLIVVDEEHSPTFKQFDPAPRYHARGAALMRARMEGAVAILGSATPSLESFYHGEQERYVRLELSSRADGIPMPEVRVIDRTDKEENEGGGEAFTPKLLEEIWQRIGRGEQVILLQNRRGYSTFIRCLDCGYVLQCPHCAISLTYHKRGRRLRCHYCGYSHAAPSVCPACGGTRLQQAGTGTQRVEEELEAALPELRVARMDMDTTSSRGSHRRILTVFEQGGYHVLLGTQMVAKGLDMPEVTLVGVISADTELFLPDFRAGERTFALLSQAAGRAGRRAKPGTVLIQTYHPTNPVLEPVMHHDYREFYGTEIVCREELGYPPFGRLGLIRFRGRVEQEVQRAAAKFAELLRDRIGHLEIMGPAPAAIVKAKDQYIYQVLVKSSREEDPAGEQLRHGIGFTNKAFGASSGFGGVSVVVDIDPAGFG